MERPETINGGRSATYPWSKLQVKGDFFELKKCKTAKKANSVRSAGRNQKLKVSVLRAKKGGHYVVTLLESRVTE